MIDPAVEQLIRDGFERWSRGQRDLDADWISPDIEIHSGFGEFGGGVHRGREAVARWAAEMQEAFVEWRLEVRELEEFAPGRVLGVGAVHMRGRGSGVSVDQPCAWILDHADGRLTRLEPFLNRVDEARALAAAGSPSGSR